MSPARRIAAFLVGLVLAGGAGAALGTVVGPIDTGGSEPHAPAHEDPATTVSSDPSPTTTHGGDHGG